MIDTLSRIRESLLAATAPGRECRQIGPFCAMLSPHEEMVWMNYAVPNAPLEGGFESDLDALETFFRSRNRQPRFEFFPELAPSLEAELVRRGYEIQGRMPLMVCTPESFIPRFVEGVQVLSPDGDVERACRVAERAFGGPGNPSEQQIALNREAMRAGRMRIASSEVATAFLVGDDEIAELCGVGTLPDFRRQGHASAVSSALIGPHLQSPNALVWLSAGDEAAEKTYERLGFSRVGLQLNYILPA